VTYTPPANATGNLSFTIAASGFTDAAGNTNAAYTTVNSITVDTLAPTITNLRLANDSGVSSSDTLTNDATILYTAENNAQVAIDWGTGTFVPTDKGTGADQSPFVPANLTDGSKTIHVRATDAAGNVTTQSLTINLDKTAPSQPTLVTTSAVRQADIAITAPGAQTTAWLAPDGTTTFAEGPTMTKTASTTIKAPGNDGTYKLYLVDNAGNVSTASSDTLTVTSPPYVMGVYAPNGTYAKDDVLPVTVKFSKPVTVTGTPTLTLETGTTDRTVNYTAGSGTDTLTFNYTVQAGDVASDLNYVSTTALALNSGTIKFGGIDATLTLPALNATGSLASNAAVVIDGVLPVVNSVTSDKTNAAYKAGESIDIKVQFSENITVNTTNGTPGLLLETGTVDREALYQSGTGTNTLTFRYTVQEGDTSADLDYTYTSTTALALHGASLTDSAGNDATLTLAAIGASGSLGNSKNLVIDTTPPGAPSITGITTGTGGVTTSRSPAFNLTVDSDTASIQLYTRNLATGADTTITTGTGTTSVAYSGTAWADGTYNVVAKAVDAAGNQSETTSSVYTVVVDTVAPTATITGAKYEEISNGTTTTQTLTLTGTGFNTLLAANESGTTEVKDRLNWSKLVWDTNHDGNTTTNVTFTSSDITSAWVTSDTTLRITPSDSKAPSLGNNTSYDQLSITAGFLKDKAGNAATSDAASPVLSGANRLMTLNLANSANEVTPDTDTGADRILINQTGTGTVNFSSASAVTDIQVKTVGTAITLTNIPASVTNVSNDSNNPMTATLSSTVDAAIIGGGGNDVLTLNQATSGKGFDVLGGAGADQFKFERIPAGRIDFNDFSGSSDSGQGDKLLFKTSAFSGVVNTETIIATTGTDAPAATTNHGQLLYNQATGTLYYDADGNVSTHSPVVVTYLGIGTVLTTADIETYS